MEQVQWWGQLKEREHARLICGLFLAQIDWLVGSNFSFNEHEWKAKIIWNKSSLALARKKANAAFLAALESTLGASSRDCNLVRISRVAARRCMFASGILELSFGESCRTVYLSVSLQMKKEKVDDRWAKRLLAIEFQVATVQQFFNIELPAAAAFTHYPLNFSYTPILYSVALNPARDKWWAQERPEIDGQAMEFSLAQPPQRWTFVTSNLNSFLTFLQASARAFLAPLLPGAIHFSVPIWMGKRSEQTFETRWQARFGGRIKASRVALRAAHTGSLNCRLIRRLRLSVASAMGLWHARYRSLKEKNGATLSAALMMTKRRRTLTSSERLFK